MNTLKDLMGASALPWVQYRDGSGGSIYLNEGSTLVGALILGYLPPGRGVGSVASGGLPSGPYVGAAAFGGPSWRAWKGDVDSSVEELMRRGWEEMDEERALRLVKAYLDTYVRIETIPT